MANKVETYNGGVQWKTGASAGMTLGIDGNVGIGETNPLSKLVISNGSGENLEFFTGNGTLNGGGFEYVNRGDVFTRPDLNYYLSSEGGAHKFFTNRIERMRIDASGNVGIGTTPWSYYSDRRSIDIKGTAGPGMSINTDGLDAQIWVNAYFDGTMKYKGNGPASSSEQYNGAFVWRTAPSGTAGNPITWTNAMTLDANGALSVLGNVTAPTFVGNLSGNASTATTLKTTRTINGVSFNGSANIWIEGRLATAVASAATTTIGTVGNGETVHITGTTAITSLGVSSTGVYREVVFDGALTLTSNATSLILPTAANIVTAAGDSACFICENGASGYWRCVNYQRANGTPLLLGNLSTTGSAATLTTARNISGVSFNGSANIEIEDRLGTAIASAATITVGTVGLGDYIHITGTTTITSLGTAGRVGVRRTLIFDGALTLTHNATSLICPGATSIVTVAGTVIEVVAETTANWMVVSITHPSISATELGYLDGVTSAIQTQINNTVKLTGNETIAGVKTFSNGIKLQNQNVSPYSGFKNYIINGKKTINQRALPTTDNSYNQDRWYKVGNNWYQGIEGDNNLISGKTYTLSWTGAATASYYIGVATSATINAQTFIPIANGANFTPTITAGQNLWIKFISDANGSTFNYVQLEEGSVATPFENRPYGLELSLCQRYYETGVFKHWAVSSASGQVLGSTLQYSALKRVNPTISSFNISTVNCSGVVTNESNFSSLITYTTSSVVGVAVFSYYWTASAEL